MNINNPKVSINILNWNRKKELKELLLNLKNQSYQDFEIVLIDNNSTDGSFEMVKKEFPDVNVIKVPHNLGVSGGRNVCIVNSIGDYLVFIDNDAEVEKDCIEKIVNIFEIEPKAGILTFKILNYYTGKLEPSCWDFDENLLKNDHIRPVNTFAGGGCAIRKEVIKEIGILWDKLFFMHEEKDYSMRLLKTKFGVFYAPQVKVYHKISPDKRFKPNERFYYYGIRNEIWIYLKNVPFILALEHIPKVICFSMLYSIRKGYFRYFLRGLFEGFLKSISIMKIRKPMSKSNYRIYKGLQIKKKENILNRFKRFLLWKS